MDLLDLDETEASQYAGYLASSFMVGRALTSLAWGRAADRYGRTTVLSTSLLLQCIGSIAFGLVRRSFAAALAIRFLLGCSNGIMGSIKTIVSEISSKEDEARNMTFVIGMWGWGFLISPAISGALAEPVRQYPDTEWLQTGVLSNVLRKHPFLLPNLLASLFCLIGMVTVALFVRETLPKEQRRSGKYMLSDAAALCRKCLPGARYQSLPVLKAHESDVDFCDPEAVEKDEKDDVTANASHATMCSLMSRKQTRIILSIYWAYSFVSQSQLFECSKPCLSKFSQQHLFPIQQVGLTVDETFPLFCMSREAGLGLAEAQIGKILSLCGLIFAICQYFVYAAIYNRFGLYGSIRAGSMLSAPIMFLVPFSLLIQRNTGGRSDLSWPTFVYLSMNMATYRIFALVFFSSVTVALNRTVPVSQRASVNGLSMLGGSVAKGLGPAFAGFLVSTAVALLGKFGSLLMFGTIGTIGCGVMTSTFLLLHDDRAVEDTSTKQDEAQAIELIDRKESNSSSKN